MGDLPVRTSVGAFTDGNTNLLVLNREFEKSLEARILLYHIYKVSRGDGKQYLRDTADAILLRIQPGEEEPPYRRIPPAVTKI